jgi:phosphoglycolate phosphatase
LPGSAASGENERLMRLLFDLDGTLTDSRKGIARCFAHALAAMGRTAPPDLTPYIGPPIADSFALLLDTSDAGDVERAIALYRERFERVGMFENALYPGIEGALAELAGDGHDLRVVTAKPRVYARRILEHFGIAGWFQGVFGPELGHRHCTKASLIRAACADGARSAASVVMIGDRADDVLGARQAGVPAIAVTWGYGDRAELADAAPDATVRTTEQLVACVRFRSS